MARHDGERYVRIFCENRHVLEDLASMTTTWCQICNSGKWFYQVIRPTDKFDTEWIEWCNTGNHQVTLQRNPTWCNSCRVIICETCVGTTYRCPSCNLRSLR